MSYKGRYGIDEINTQQDFHQLIVDRCDEMGIPADLQPLFQKTQLILTKKACAVGLESDFCAHDLLNRSTKTQLPLQVISLII